MIGLTGGIACGKSEVARILATAGAAVREADDVAHRLLAPGTPVFAQVVARFGRGILGPDGRVDRRRLGRRVFGRRREREALNAIVHPEVLRRLGAWLAAQRRRGRDAVAVVPLLYEVGWLAPWDAVVCVTAPRAVAVARLRQKGYSDAEARARLAAQLPVAAKARRADFVIRNAGSLAELRRASLNVWKRVLKGDSTSCPM
jgi:dephospho-CoA kinase